MALLKGLLAFIILLVVVIALWYVADRLKLPSGSILPGANTTATTTVASGQPGGNATVNGTTTIPYVSDCINVFFSGGPNSNSVVNCVWNGGPMGLWVASGNSASESVRIVGADNSVYVNQTSSYGCLTFFKNFTAPAQLYTVSFKTGAQISAAQWNCTEAIAKLNTTLSPQQQIYQNVYNGNFGSGTYTGWTVTNVGFGTAPLNITKANIVSNTMSGCFRGQPWSNYNGTFFATTFNCGLTNAPGNITSAPFNVGQQSFLNFKIISPEDNLIYVEILYNGTPQIIAHYNTYNSTLYPNASSQFRNASIPLYNVINKPIQIRVVAISVKRSTYIAVGDFSLANRPVQDRGIGANLTFINS